MLQGHKPLDVADPDIEEAMRDFRQRQPELVAARQSNPAPAAPEISRYSNLTRRRYTRDYMETRMKNRRRKKSADVFGLTEARRRY